MSSTQKPTANKKRLVYVIGGGVLAVILLLATEEKKKPAPPQARSKPAPKPQERVARARAIKWPAANVSQLASHNPFSRERLFAPLQPEPQKKSALPETPETRPIDLSRFAVTAVYEGPQGPAAIINGKVVSVGDELAGGLVVVAITRNGISVERPLPLTTAQK